MADRRAGARLRARARDRAPRATGRLDGYDLPNARIALDTAVAVVASIVAILTAIRFLVEGRAWISCSRRASSRSGSGPSRFAVAPVLSGTNRARPVEAWAAIGASLFGAALIAVAPFVVPEDDAGASARSSSRSCSSSSRSLGIWFDARFLGLDLEHAGPDGSARRR